MKRTIIDVGLPGYNPDDDPGYDYPRAWRDAKKELGDCHRLGELLKALEVYALSLPEDPRNLLAAAVLAFLTLPDAQKEKAFQDHNSWSGDVSMNRDEALRKIFPDGLPK